MKEGLGERLMKFMKSQEKEKLSILQEFSVEDIPSELIVGEDA